MNRLLLEFDVQSLDVLVNNDTELFLLMENRHVKYEKTDVGRLLTYKQLVTDNVYLCPSDIVTLAKPYLDLYSTDIKEIKQVNDVYVVSIHPHCLVYTGTFNIKIFK